MEHLLADLAADDEIISATPALLRTLRRRSPLQGCSPALRARWCERMTVLLRGERPALRHAGAMLVAESTRQLDEPTFAAHRDQWVGALSSMAAQRGETSASRQAACGALASLLATAARFPAQKREIAPHAPRLLSALVPMLERDRPAGAGEDDATSGGTAAAELRAMAALRILSSAAPHTLRPHRERLLASLARILLEPTPDGGAPDARSFRAVAAAAELLAGLAAAAGSGPQYADAWLHTVTLLCGTLHALLRRALGSVSFNPVDAPQAEPRFPCIGTHSLTASCSYTPSWL